MRMQTTVFAAISGIAIGGCIPEPDAGDIHEIINNLRQAGYHDDDIAVASDAVYLEGDVEVTLAASREMLQPDGSTKEQYRVANLVGGPNPSTICVNGAAFTGSLSTGLNLALGNYNALFGAGLIRLRFVRVTGGPIAGCTFFINGQIQVGAGGSAGFPSGGAPFPLIQIGSGLAAFGVDIIEHVITHELGHCIGLHHSDIAVPGACGGTSPGLGAIHIFGTPTGFTPSVWNCTIDPSLGGEFSPTDVTALNILY